MPSCRNCGYLVDDLDWDNNRACPRCGADPHQVPPSRQQEETVFGQAVAAVFDDPLVDSLPPREMAPEHVLQFAEYARGLGNTVGWLMPGVAISSILAAVGMADGTQGGMQFAGVCGLVGGIMLWVVIHKLAKGFAFGLSAVGQSLVDQYLDRYREEAAASGTALSDSHE
jgi:hypothetical protein